MCVRKFCRLDYLFPGRTGLAVTDVLDDSSGEKIYVLLNDADMVTQALELDVTDIFSVDLNRTAGNVVEPRNKAAERCLSAAGRSDKRDI